MIFRATRAAAAVVLLAAMPLAASSLSAWAQGTAAPAAGAQDKSAQDKNAQKGDKAADPVVATVNGAPIHRSEVEAARQDLPAQYQSFPIDIVFAPLVERLIDSKLLAVQGRKEGLASDPEVKARMAQIEDQVIQTAYLTRMIKAKLTDDVLKKEYEKFLKDNPPEPELHVRHIVMPTEDEAKAVIKQIKDGADFEKLAKEKSTGSSAAEGGDVGFIKEHAFGAFSEAAFKLKPGQISDAPVKTQFGWHVIKVEESRMSAPPKFEEVRDDLERAASRQVINKLIDDLRGSAKIVRFNPDGSPKTEGGAGKPDAGKPDAGKPAPAPAKPAQ